MIHNIVNKGDGELRDRLYGELNKVLDMARNGDRTGASIALEQILGEYSTRAKEATQAVAQNFSGSVFGHLAQMRDARVASNGAAARSDGALASMRGGYGYGLAANRIWAGGFGTFTRQDNSAGAQGYKYDAGGFILGYDRQFGQNITAGFTGAYSRGRVEGNDGYSTTDVDTANLGLYASYDPECGFYAEGHLGFGYTWNDEHEDMILGGARDGEYETWSVQAGGNVGYAFLLPSAFRVIPTVGVQFIHVEQKEHAQTGNGLPMWFDSSSTNYVKIPVAVRVNKTFELDCGISVTPEARASWIYEAKKDKASLRAGYVGSAESFMLSGTNPGRHRALVGAGVKARLSRNVDAFVDYNLEFRSGYRNHNIMAGVGVSF